MFNFLLGCVILAVCLYIGGVIISIVFSLFMLAVSAVFSLIGWIYGMLK